MVQKGYFNGALEADMKFHETIVEYSGNEKVNADLPFLAHTPVSPETRVSRWVS
jgi:DNA-binding GntR family transcriptional regulator